VVHEYSRVSRVLHGYKSTAVVRGYSGVGVVQRYMGSMRCTVVQQ